MSYIFHYDIAALIAFAVLMCFVLARKHIFDETFIQLMILTVSAALVPITDLWGTIAIERNASVNMIMVSNMAYYISHVITTFVFLVYVISQVEMRRKQAVAKRVAIYAPILLVLVIILMNPLLGTVFTYTRESGFQRGFLYGVILVTPLAYFLWAVIYILKNRKWFKQQFIRMIIFVAVLNTAAIVFQYFNSHWLVRGYMLSLSAIVMFFFDEHNRIRVEEETRLVEDNYLYEQTSRSIRNKMPIALILVKISNYGGLCDIFGSRNIKRLGERVASYIGHKYKFGTAFRISESTIAISTLDVKNVERMSEELFKELDKTWELDGIEIYCDILVSCIIYPNHVKNIETCTSYLRHFVQMTKGSKGYVPIEDLNINEYIRKKQVENVINDGLRNNNFEVVYQPIKLLESEEFVTAEALLRLTDPELGPVSPAEFIPIAEESGAIVQIGNFVLDSVCDFIEKNDMDELGLHYIELNLSVIQCLQKDFIETVDAIVKKHNIDPKYLCLEVTETASNYSPAVFKRNLETLGDMGYTLALDDFGSGYANIERMVESEFRIVKFDKEMTQYSNGEEKHQVLFEKMQNVIHSIDAKVVAEGVETKEQYEKLKEIGCDYIQGYYFSKPIKRDDFVSFLLENRN